jgi:hypothetical protein
VRYGRLTWEVGLLVALNCSDQPYDCGDDDEETQVCDCEKRSFLFACQFQRHCEWLVGRYDLAAVDLKDEWTH